MEVRLPVWHVSSKILPDSGNGSLTSLLFYTYKVAECIDRERQYLKKFLGLSLSRWENENSLMIKNTDSLIEEMIVPLIINAIFVWLFSNSY